MTETQNSQSLSCGQIFAKWFCCRDDEDFTKEEKCQNFETGAFASRENIYNLLRKSELCAIFKFTNWPKLLAKLKTVLNCLNALKIDRRKPHERATCKNIMPIVYSFEFLFFFRTLKKIKTMFFLRFSRFLILVLTKIFARVEMPFPLSIFLAICSWLEKEAWTRHLHYYNN
ncbi:unnamed protein product [Oikopleura dioica]|uniref:Uncharacterized protein n=1 Tax=Oikopleura dioica TaxID=34765 RepID=E4YAH3_OIKDI|nr:unnamed protein product [Oikopleura dioica]